MSDKPMNMERVKKFSKYRSDWAARDLEAEWAGSPSRAIKKYRVGIIRYYQKRGLPQLPSEYSAYVEKLEHLYAIEKEMEEKEGNE